MRYRYLESRQYPQEPKHFHYNNRAVLWEEMYEDVKWKKDVIIKKRLNPLLYLKWDAMNYKTKTKQHQNQTVLLFLFFFRNFMPENRTLYDRYRFGILKLKHISFWRYYRFFMGFPSRGQRTWSNAQSAKKRFNFVKEAETKITERQFKFTCPPEPLKRLCHMEFLNSMWYEQWHHEWVAARRYRLNYNKKFRYKTWKFGFSHAVRNRALTYFNDPRKKVKKNRKKIILPKNLINIGLPPKFGKIFYKKIFSKNIWRRRRAFLF